MNAIRILLIIVNIVVFLNVHAQTPEGVVISPQNTSELEEIASVQVDARSIRSVLFSPDSRFFVTLKRYDASMDLWDSTARQQWFDNALEVWSVETRERIFALSGHTDKVTHIEFQPNGVLLASASEDGTVRLWNVETGELTLSKTFNGNLISDITFSPDGQFLAIVDGSAFPESANNRVVILDISTRKEVYVIDQAYAFVTVFDFDGQNIFVAGSDAKVGVWTLDESGPLDGGQIYESSLGIPIIDITLSRDGGLAAIDDVTGLNIVDAREKSFRVTYANHLDIDFVRRHYGDVFALIAGNEKVHLINITTEQTLPGEFSLDELGAMRAINKSETILVAVNDDQINLADSQTGAMLSSLTHDDVFDVTFSLDGKYIASWSASSGLLKLWGVDE